MAPFDSTLTTKISPLIDEQTPDFIREDHPVFVQLLKDYYKFLESAELVITATVDHFLQETISTQFILDEVGEKIVHNLSFNRIGNGGFSLRSKKFLEYSSTFSDTTFLAEDIFLNIFNYDYAKNFGIKYPDIETAINFSYEIPLKGKSLEKKAKKESLNLNNHFGWHGKHFSNYQELLDLKFSR